MPPSHNIFAPEKINLIDFKMKRGQVDTPENFDLSKIDGYDSDSSLRLGFNLKDKIARVDLMTNIKTLSAGHDGNETKGNFHLVYFYHIENLDELATMLDDHTIDLNPFLANALASVTYSTSRGVLLTRLQGTTLQNFILPIIDPNQLLNDNISKAPNQA
jgi:hypothetical protein